MKVINNENNKKDSLLKIEIIFNDYLEGQLVKGTYKILIRPE